MTLVTNTFATAGVVLASEVNQNFADLIAAVDDVGGDQIADAAGIVATQLADRYVPFVYGPIQVLPITSGADLSSMANYVLPTSAVEVLRDVLAVKSGRKAFICGAEVYAYAATTATIELKINSDTLGGSARTLSGAARDYVQNASPFDNPLIAIQDGDVFAVELGGSGSPTARGVTVTLFGKMELVP